MQRKEKTNFLMKTVIVTGLLMMSFLVPVSATPSSLIWIPSTDIQTQDKTHFGIDSYFTPQPLKAGETTGAFTTPDYGLTWGYKNFEFGIDYIASQNDPVYFNAKVKLLGKKATDLNLVAGIYNVGTTSATNSEVKYVMGSVATKDGTRFTLGYGFGRQEVLGDDHNMIMAGIDKQLNDKWWVGVDYQGGKSSLGALSVGAAYNFTPNVSLLVGYSFYNNQDYKNTITTQIDINF